MASFISHAEYNAYLIPLVLALSCVVTYLTTSLTASEAFRSKRGDKKPPLAPYWTPVFGHALSFFWNTGVVAELTKSGISSSGVVCLRFFTTKMNFVTGSDNIMAVWRSKVLDAKAVTCFSLKNFFDTPDKAMKIYFADNSGINPQPHSNSNVPPKDRYYFLTRKETVGFFNGPGLKHFGNRFGAALTKEVGRLDLDDCKNDWVEHEDLYAFIQNLLIGPAIEAMCGPVLLDQNPTFVDDFWKFDSDMLYFFKGYPRLFAPRAWRNRTRVLDSLKRWHAYARENFEESCIESDGHDRFYGSPLMRSRQDYLPKVDSLDADALASQDLGLIWAENANSIPAVFWMMLEALQRPDLLSQTLSEVLTSQSRSRLPGNPHMNIDALCGMPLLQSAYAETLRVYTSLFALRSAAHQDFHLGEFRIPKDQLIAVDSRVAAMNRHVWNTGAATEEKPEGAHPLDRFWAERFLVYPHDPTSGPLRFGNNNNNNNNNPSTRAPAPAPKAASVVSEPHHSNPNPNGNGNGDGNGNGPHFTMDGLAGAWLPFGGGSRQCPGRNFAKQEIILSFAVVFSMLEIELLEGSGGVGAREPDMKYYGLGTLPPKGKVPFRMRRRV